MSPTLRAPAPPSGTRQPEAAGAPQKTCAGSAGTLQSELEKVRRNGAPAPARPPPDGGQLAFGPGLRLRGPPPQTVISGQLRKGRAEWPTGPTAGRRPVSSWAPAGLVSQRHGLCDTVRLRPAARGGRSGLPPAAPAGTRRCAPLSFGYQVSVLNCFPRSFSMKLYFYRLTPRIRASEPADSHESLRWITAWKGTRRQSTPTRHSFPSCPFQSHSSVTGCIV